MHCVAAWRPCHEADGQQAGCPAVRSADLRADLRDDASAKQPAPDGRMPHRFALVHEVPHRPRQRRRVLLDFGLSLSKAHQPSSSTSTSSEAGILLIMPAHHAKTRPLVVANARHRPAMAALCAQIGRVLARRPVTLKKLSASRCERVLCGAQIPKSATAQSGLFTACRLLLKPPCAAPSRPRTAPTSQGSKSRPK